jgi:hypothetical protein
VARRGRLAASGSCSCTPGCGLTSFGGRPQAISQRIGGQGTKTKHCSCCFQYLLTCGAMVLRLLCLAGTSFKQVTLPYQFLLANSLNIALVGGHFGVPGVYRMRTAVDRNATRCVVSVSKRRTKQELTSSDLSRKRTAAGGRSRHHCCVPAQRVGKSRRCRHGSPWPPKAARDELAPVELALTVANWTAPCRG